jgi:arylsulfatase A-like enzyme/tetratricopeptide (TPR) repeat protein
MKISHVVVGFLFALSACQSSGPKPPADAATARPIWNRLNILLVTIDTLRADHLGCYGYSRIATPNLDRLADQGILFENAVAQTPLTPPSHASMFTGTNPNVHQVRGTGGFVLDASKMTLAEILQQHGWQTAAFVGAPVLKRIFGLNQGFETYDDRMPEPDPAKTSLENPSLRAATVVDRAVEWLDTHAGSKPFFLWVHVYDPHAPFDPPSPFRERYPGRPYDGEIAYVDQEVGRLVDNLGKKSNPEQTIVAVLSDHGESLSEHGEYSHGVFLYDSTLRIPWIMKGPGLPAGRRIKEQARTIDLLPTLLGVIGGEVPAASQGVNLLPALAGKPVNTTYSYAETLYPKINMGWAELRGMRTSKWKYIRAPRPELYDLEKDPGETQNVHAMNPAEVKRLENELATLTSTGEGQPSERVGMKSINAETEKQLRSLGYVSAGAAKSLELTGKGVDPKDRVHILELIDEASTPQKSLSGPQRLRALEQALKEDPGNPLLYYFLGEAYEKNNRDLDALKLYETAVKKQVPTNNRVFVRMALIYGRQGKVDEGIAAFERALDADPSDIETQNRLAVAYLLRGRVAEAERLLQAVLVLNEEDPQAYNSLGWLAMRRGDQPRAIQHFERAIKLNPELMEAYLNLGMLYKRKGDVAQARANFETFLARAPQNKYRDSIQRVRQELRELGRTGS